MSLCKIGMYRMRMGRETDPQQHVEKNKFFNRLDEAFDFMCTHISQDLLFHLEGLRTPKEDWEKIEPLFGKKMRFEGIYWRMSALLYNPAVSNLFNNYSQNTSH